MRSRLLTAVLVLAACGCGGCSSTSASAMTPTPTTTPANTSTVNIVGRRNASSFDPNPAPVVQGAFVVWRNTDSAVHRIVMNDGSFDSGDIGPGASSQAMRLGSSGGGYHCTIHPTAMFGSINVPTSEPPPSQGPGY